MTQENRQSVKQYNRNRVFRLIASRQRISKQEIAAELNLSLPTTTQNLNSLKEEGLISENGTFDSQIGRKARAISIVPNYRVAMGLDITPHHISLVLADLNGSIIDHVRKKFTVGANEASYIALRDNVEAFVRQNHINPAQILGLGISVPGIVSFDKKEIINAATLPLPANFCEIFEKYFSFPCHMFNDASCAGIAEFWRNDYENETIAYLLLSNTVGGAILVDGVPYAGRNNRSAEFGHITIEPGGRRCSCGKQGCAEIYCSALFLSGHTDNNLETFFRELDVGNQEYEALLKEYLRNLSILINDVNMCLDCQVVLGGYMGTYLKRYIGEIRQLVSERCTFATDGGYVRACTCEFEAAALGAALSYIEEFIKSV
ncbi:ROK family transcriptional regulator [Bariatricus massiliensis]|uniref:ROK family transcriptional regulator n=1 Tax=Bariatricus massiliensis TaxID=1745713 RepID=A0ABS8DKQ9_9FIRM|nr:ROK family transcriptional regulator [Bariatricus massiliensis]MCB7305898.1 ROK family transcriptional regulator [Bariatricus massiliensis]MCB7376512.1 ROK family transcriptional regulator [Bariatricus massiliensis]MCB7389041.1 ROK family transcriptional regulator [Bariatricus massiliensis]MCB7413214.1 ROK family transcriptional regulator [Bariatricus massiliensis]MCQ5255110.1 ROK family transcriptional regulator [Bariatricus massiliensis]